MLVIKAKRSIGLLCIGDNIYNAIELLDNKYKTFKRTVDSVDTIYAFDNRCLHLTCSMDDIIQVISIFRPQEVTYCDIQLLGRKSEDVKKQLIDHGIVVNENDVGLWIEEAGVFLVDIDGYIDGLELSSD